jgi:predicted signal transduction protein with EAL and GGDEF domain
VTLSAGVAGCVPDAQVVADVLIDRADRALYAAKRAGRNMALAFSEMPPAGAAPAIDFDVGEAAGPATLH